ncbi:hypothetical protein E1B28_008344 [Marasmius oreades]|uniref:Uncharacterized protein n=1 Tax=Marasmius oreades TaxID=181124 RepID=A0A9P7USA9_9AGAR|nr:uncharacterized protein E1B28_008344 [Marasmius oreades]KAG7091955.1 hypothetical protein E1B28_008344 [Marasmius oreades]
MVHYTQDQVLQLANFHVGGLRGETLSSKDIPESYILELSSFLKDYPHDYNFRLVTQPNKGYGKLRCDEDSCRSGPIIILDRNKQLQDGGLKDGVGSLSSYKMHINRHPYHTHARDLRVQKKLKNENTENIPSSFIKRERSDTKLTNLKHDASPQLSARALLSSSSTHTPSHCATTSQSSAPLTPLEAARQRASRKSLRATIKPEPAESIPQKRRLSDMSDECYSVLTRHPSLPKPEPTQAVAQHSLLESIDNIAPARDNAAQAIKMDTDGIRDRIHELTSQMSSVQTLLDNALRKKTKTQSDFTRIRHHQEKVQGLGRERDELKDSLPTIPFSPSERPVTSGQEITSIKQDLHQQESTLEHERFEQNLGRFPIATAGPSSAALAPPPVFHQPPPPQHLYNDNNTGHGFVGIAEAAAPVQISMANASAAVAECFHNGIETVHDPYDEDGNFYGRGRDTYQGPQAKADDIEKFLIEAGNAEQFDGSVTVDKALKDLGLSSIYVPLPNMEVALMPHQAIGVAWMHVKERGVIKGGCLADEMGLGKTVQMLALMTMNPSTNPTCKTNLIIAPLALLDQWKLEIELKTNDVFKCLIYHGNNKPKRKSELLSYDVVITTPSTMALEWPDLEKEMKREKATMKKKKEDDFIDDSDSDGPTRKKRKRERGLLFQVEFYRIILDEAQLIRSRKTRVSRAITDLSATYRWCLTGTPIINSLSDAYGVIRFLRVRPFYDWDEFNRHVARLEKKRPDLAVVKLQKIFDTFLLRRKKDTMLDGKRLIELPARNVHLNRLIFSEEEREIYDMVERNSQAIFNRYLRAGTVLKNYHHVLVLLLRLRQICSHPCLIQEDGGAFIMPDEIENDSRPMVRKELARARDLVSQAFVIKLKERFKHEALERIKAEKECAEEATVSEECPICFDAYNAPVVTPCAHIFCHDCIRDVLNGPQVQVADDPTKYTEDERPCPACRGPIHANKLFSRSAFEPTDEDLFPPEKLTETDLEMDEVDEFLAPKNHNRKVKKGKKLERQISLEDSEDIVDVDAMETVTEAADGSSQPRRSSRAKKNTSLIVISDEESGDEDEDDSMSDFIVDDDADLYAPREPKKKLGKRKFQVVLDSEEEIDDTPEEKEVIFGRKKKPKTAKEIKLTPKFLPSTKMKWMIEEIGRLAKEKPEEKILIISQWTGCLSLVSDYLLEYGVRHVKYQGDMNRVKREQAVRVFMSKENAPIMLMSMKCGGVGLNLTRGNNVISLDLGWSQAVENQAFDRVHRLGQTKPVNVQRLVIENTVEDRILALQERKQNLADGSLGEGNAKKIGKLSVKELANLFGLDHYGRLLAQ